MSLIVTVTPITLNQPDKLEYQRTYARNCVHHGLLHDEYYKKGNSPFHGDLMYHHIFNLNHEKEISLFEKVKSAWMHDAKEAHIYMNYGFTQDMINQVDYLIKHNIPIKFEKLLDCYENNNQFDANPEWLIEANSIPQHEIIQYMKSRNILAPFGYRSDYLKEPKQEIFNHENLNLPNLQSQDFQRVILESPFAGDVASNVKYAKALIHDLAYQGVAASASHLLYTQMLDDTKDFDRNLGINKGLDYAHNKDSIIGIDRGISTGMKYGIQRAINENRNYTFKTLSKNKKVISEVNSLRDIQDAEDYVLFKSLKNKFLFEKTGYLNETYLTPKVKKIRKNKLNS